MQQFVDEIQVTMNGEEAAAVMHAICEYMERLEQKKGGGELTAEEREEAMALMSFCQKVGPLIRQKVIHIALYRDSLT